MAGKIKVKRGTTAQWADSSTNDTTLAPGQPGVEYCEDGKTKLKIGPHTADGSSTEWANIDYISADGITEAEVNNIIGETLDGVSFSKFQTTRNIISSDLDILTLSPNDGYSQLDVGKNIIHAYTNKPSGKGTSFNINPDGDIVVSVDGATNSGTIRGLTVPEDATSDYVATVKYVKDAIRDLSSIKVARVVIGTSTSGWTSSDCDYLCGSQASDSDTIQLAINDLKAAGGGEILFLDGDYLVGPLITIQDVNISIKGSGIVTFHQQNTSTVATDGMFKITSSTSTNELYEVVFDNVRFLGLNHNGTFIVPPDNYLPSAINCITNTASLTIRNCVADGFNAPGTAAFVCGNGLSPRVTNTFENNKIINSYTAIRSYVQYGDLEIINNDIAVSTYGIDFENYTYKDIYIVGNNISVSSGSMSDTSYCVYFPSDFNFSGGCELVIKNNTLICGASYSGAIMLQNLPSDYKRKNMIDSNLFTTANNTTPSLTSRGIFLLPTLHKKIHGLSISNNIFESLGTGIQYTITLSGTPGVEPKNIITNNIFNNLVGSCIDIYGKGITSVSNNIGTTLADSAFVGESYVTNSTNNIWNGVPSFNTKPCGITAYMDTSLGTVTTSAGEVQIPLDGIASSYGNISLSSNAIQIKETGYYYVDGQVMFNNGVANKYMGIKIVKNGDTTLMDAYYSMGSVDYGCVNTSGSIIKLTAGDTITLYARVPNSEIVMNASSRTKLTVFKLF